MTDCIGVAIVVLFVLVLIGFTLWGAGKGELDKQSLDDMITYTIELEDELRNLKDAYFD